MRSLPPQTPGDCPALSQQPPWAYKALAVLNWIDMVDNAGMQKTPDSLLRCTRHISYAEVMDTAVLGYYALNHCICG
eukprot:7225328-Pyramimonas_sp.AAC.1